MAGPCWGCLCRIVVIRLVFFVVLTIILASIQNELGGDPSKQTIDQACDLPAGDDLGVDEVMVKLEDEVNYLSCVHALLNVASQGDLVDTDLIGRQLL